MTLLFSIDFDVNQYDLKAILFGSKEPILYNVRLFSLHKAKRAFSFVFKHR